MLTPATFSPFATFASLGTYIAALGSSFAALGTYFVALGSSFAALRAYFAALGTFADLATFGALATVSARSSAYFAFSAALPALTSFFGHRVYRRAGRN